MNDSIPVFIIPVTISYDSLTSVWYEPLNAIDEDTELNDVTFIFPSLLETLDGVLVINWDKTLIELFWVLTKVWPAWGRCFTAPLEADTKVWTDWGSCLTALLDADTNVCNEP